MAVDADAADPKLSAEVTAEATPEHGTAPPGASAPLAERREGEVSDGNDAQDLDAGAGAAQARRTRSPVRLAIIVGLVMVVVLGGLFGWLSYRDFDSHRADQLRRLYVHVARQGAVNLTTIDYTHVEADVARILDSSTGTFHDDFEKRAQPFIDVVKKAQSQTVGTVTEAGLAAVQDGQAQVLVAVQVKTSLAGAADPQPRGWRMLIDVRGVGETVKVSNVVFVP